MQKIEPSFSALTDSSNQRNLWEVAEYASLIGSAVGTLLAAASQQVVFAAAPLTLAVSLNFLNRSRIAQKTEPSDIASLRSHNDSSRGGAPVPALPIFPAAQSLSTTAIEQEIAELRESLSSLQENTAAQVEDVYQYVDDSLGGMNLNAVRSALRELRSSAERLEKTALNEQDWETFNVRFLLIEEAIAELQAIAASQPQPSVAPADLSQFAEAFALLRAEQQTQNAELQHRLAQLEQKNRAIVKPYLQRLVADVKQLREQLAAERRPH